VQAKRFISDQQIPAPHRLFARVISQQETSD
jgi:hypothetical protein